MAEAERVVVFDVSDATTLRSSLSTAFPDTRFAFQKSWEFKAGLTSGDIPVWYWPSDLAALQRDARRLLLQFVYPLVASGSSYCVAFPFDSAALLPQELDIESMQCLDVEDIGMLLSFDAYTTTLQLLPQLRDRVVQTPIEEQLARALVQAGIKARPQVTLGQYRVDFLIEQNGRRVVVEADGRGFHDPDRDRARDQALVSLGIEAVLRFTGSRIYRDATGCASDVAQYLRLHRPAMRQDSLEGNLDASQLAATRHPSGAARVLAPAGAGKTKTMVNRIIELLNRGVSPNSILVLAFNRKAAEQLEHRLESLGVATSRSVMGTDSSGVVCATFNAFRFRYLREVASVQLQIEPLELAWRDMMAATLRSSGVEMRELKPVRGSDPIGQFLKAVDRVKADLQSPRGITVEIESFGDNPTAMVPFEPVY